MNNRTYYTAQMLQDEQFMQFPKWLMQDSEFSKMSNDAKVLYCLLKDRFKLSAKNHWIDKDERVFVICKRTSMEKLLHKSDKTIKKIVNELIAAELIEEKQNGLNKPNFIYLLMPKLSDEKIEEFEEDNWVENSERDDIIRTRKNYDSKIVKTTSQETKELRPNKNNSSNNKSNKDILNNNIDNTYTSKPFVVEKDLNSYIKGILYNSQIFSRYQEANDFDTFIKAVNRIIKNIEKQSKKRKEKICYFNEKQVINLLKAALEIENNSFNTFNNPDGYIVSKISEEIENIIKSDIR